MERVSLFIDFYNFISSSNTYLNQKCFIDYTKIQEYFILSLRNRDIMVLDGSCLAAGFKMLEKRVSNGKISNEACTVHVRSLRHRPLVSRADVVGNRADGFEFVHRKPDRLSFGACADHMGDVSLFLQKHLQAPAGKSRLFALFRPYWRLVQAAEKQAP